MKAIGSGGEWWWNIPSFRRKSESRRRGRRNTDPRGRRRGPRREPLSSSSSESIGQSSGWPIEFPFRQALTAASLTFAGDTIAQVRGRIVDRRRRGAEPDGKVTPVIPHLTNVCSFQELIPDILLNHDWLRALRMASYGFLLYGPGSYAWYQFLDRCMPKQTFVNLSAKVILNQIVLGPCVIAVVFAWNNLWLGKLSELPSKYQNDALPTLLYGFRFWIPVSVVNFGYGHLASLFSDDSFACPCCLHVLLFHFLELLFIDYYEQMKPPAHQVGLDTTQFLTYKLLLAGLTVCMSLVHHVICPQCKIYAWVIGYIHPTEENVKEMVPAGITVHCKVSSSWTVVVDQHKVTAELIQGVDEYKINGGREVLSNHVWSTWLYS
ncbi:hypothetical protein BAE44_0004533 [Dichanthelium oligosanthes]|uniref:Protein Mpv17 n=1 Tax=Dichanthelium oligosanthes TaxID=888268 RepID=A0A1E5WAJ5_9POAL|nr:hypothetical protein BAE44_0004533 [Dichanthelium oligosanthes]